MKLLRSVVEEIVGLFVDDWRFAGLIVACVGAGKLMALRMPGMAGPALFAGLAAVLLAFVYARAAGR